MAAIHELTSITPLPEFDIFSVPPTQTSVVRGFTTEYRPIASITSGGDIEFAVPTGFDEYLRVKDTKLYLKARIVLKKADNAAVKLDDWNKVSLENNFAATLFQQVSIACEDKPLQLTFHTYGYRAYLDTLINYGKDARTTHLSSSLWHELEDKTKLDPETLDAKLQEVISTAERDEKKIHFGKVFEVYGRLHLDYTFQNKALLGGVTYRFKLTPNRAKFVLRAKDNIEPVIEILEARLYAYKSKVVPEIVEAHNKALEVSNAKYAINRTEVRTYTINQGTVQASIDNAVSGQLPRRVYLGFVSNEAFNGSYTKNPFNFKHYNVNFLACYANSEQFPSQPYTPDFANDKYIREYNGLFEAADQDCTSSQIGINRAEYKNGYTLFGFNFAPDLSSGCVSTGHVNLIQRGSLRIEVHFAAKLPETVNLILYCEFDNIVEFDRDRNPIYNFM